MLDAAIVAESIRTDLDEPKIATITDRLLPDKCG
jgi:hypothetical protein